MSGPGRDSVIPAPLDSTLSDLCDAIVADSGMPVQMAYLEDTTEVAGEGTSRELQGRDTTRQRIAELVIGGISQWDAIWAFANREPVCLVAHQREHSESTGIARWRRDFRILFPRGEVERVQLVDSGRVDALTESRTRELGRIMRDDALKYMQLSRP